MSPVAEARQDVAIGVAERAHALALERGRDGVEVDARVAGAAERLLRLTGVRRERPGDGAVVGECA
jgi:hypothetical protein